MLSFNTIFAKLKIGATFKLTNDGEILTKFNTYDAKTLTDKIIPINPHTHVISDMDTTPPNIANNNIPMSIQDAFPGISFITPEELEKKCPGLLNIIKQTIDSNMNNTTSDSICTGCGACGKPIFQGEIEGFNVDKNSLNYRINHIDGIIHLPDLDGMSELPPRTETVTPIDM